TGATRRDGSATGGDRPAGTAVAVPGRLLPVTAESHNTLEGSETCVDRRPTAWRHGYGRGMRDAMGMVRVSPSRERPRQNGEAAKALRGVILHGGCFAPHDARHLAGAVVSGPDGPGRLGRVRRAVRAANLSLVPAVEAPERRRGGRDPKHPVEAEPEAAHVRV